MHVTLAELRAARSWAEGVGVLLTPDVMLAVALLPDPDSNSLQAIVSDELRSTLRTWGNA